MLEKLTKKLDDLYFNMHKIPADVAYKPLKFTKFDSSRLTNAIGAAGVALYNYGALNSIVNSSGSGGFLDKVTESPENAVTFASVLLVDTIYSIFIHKNWKKANVEEARESANIQQSLDGIVDDGLELQRESNSKTALWYTGTQAVWPSFLALQGNPDAYMWLAVGSIMIATDALHSSRHMLYMDFSPKKE
ncbi:MAG: hypothetical protein GY861_13505 [bacterium]|nr:hypothetical protein [bacterium]